MNWGSVKICHVQNIETVFTVEHFCRKGIPKQVESGKADSPRFLVVVTDALNRLERVNS
jgi:hypothetical protein